MIELIKALNKLQKDLKPAIKDATNPHFRSSYADLESVWEAVRGPLTENGFCITQTFSENKKIVTTLWHESGDKITSELELILGKNDMQALGSAITYARRYSLAAIVGLIQTDDDGNAAVGSPVKQTTQLKQPSNASLLNEIKSAFKKRYHDVENQKEYLETVSGYKWEDFSKLGHKDLEEFLKLITAEFKARPAATK